MLLVLLAHVVLTAVCAATATRLGPKVFLLAALGPLSGIALLVTSTGVLQDQVRTEKLTWVPGLDLDLWLRLDPLSFLMLILVSGVGFAIFAYTAWYASRGPTLTRLVWELTAFAGAMVGLVLADDVVTLYVFWELTSVTSFLLVGLDDHRREARRAARQALLVTVMGGLVMLAGLLILASLAGTIRISAILESPPPSSATLTVALLLVLVGAITKSAQVPFHTWLPAAMAAPTPVSAYLHAAAMVKAGIYLVARLAPGFGDLTWWRPLLVTFGVSTMIVGGWRALRQHDLKRLCAFSTVSQLGFLMIAAAWGTAHALTALTAMLLTHGFAKAALFMTIGIVDHSAHSRDLRRLDGLARAMPGVATAAGLAAASMAGVPLLLGFIAKEEVLTAISASPGPGTIAALTGVVLGSMLTMAYSLRLWWGAFGRKNVLPQDFDALPRDTTLIGPDDAHRQSWGMALPVMVLAALSLLLGLVPGILNPLGAAVTAAIEHEHVHYALWHGIQPELGLSATVILGGIGLFLARQPWSTMQTGLHRRLPRGMDSDLGYEAILAGIRRLARFTTSHTQTGSLPKYMGVTMVTVSVLPAAFLGLRLAQGTPLPGSGKPIHFADSGVQIGLCLLICACALWLINTQRRVAAVLLLGAVGYSVTFLFVLHGAPDLALTQILVETVSLLLFLLILRLLPARFYIRLRPWDRNRRLGIAAMVGFTMASLAYLAAQSREGGTVASEMVARSHPEAHGNNIVNVILVDFRGFDTFGEISVVFTAALGVGSLILTIRHGRGDTPAAMPSTVLSIGAGWLVPVLMLTSLFFLFAGHNNPGGGFIGGLVAGLAFVLVYLSGEDDVAKRAKVPPQIWLSVGLLMSATATLGPWFFGREILQSSYLSLHLPLLGKTGVSTVLLFDTGVYLVVTGLVLTILTTLGRRTDAALAAPPALMKTTTARGDGS